MFVPKRRYTNLVSSLTMSTVDAFSPSNASNESNGGDGNKLIVNYLPQSMSQDEVKSLFSSIGEVEFCKLMRHKITGQSLGYAFVNYSNSEDAQRAISGLNGLLLQNKTLKVSHARPSNESIKNTNLYVSGLPRNISQQEFDDVFGRYGTIISSKVVIDYATGIPKGIGFVRFDRRNEAEMAIDMLNEQSPFPGHPEAIQVKFANEPVNSVLKTLELQIASAKSSGDSNVNTNLYVSGLPKTITEQEFNDVFGRYGTITTSKIIVDYASGVPKGIGFVRYNKKYEAEMAIENTNGKSLFSGHSETLQVKFANQPLNVMQQTMELQLAQAAQILLPAMLQPVAAAAAAAAANQSWKKGNTTGGPIRHSSQVGHSRYSPMAGAPIINTATTSNQSYTNEITQYLSTVNNSASSALLPVSINHSSASASTVYPYDKTGYSVFVFNLAPDTEESVLWRMFGPFGAVLNVRIIKDLSTNKCKGYAFVTMPNYEEALSAINLLNGSQLGDRTLKVSFKT